MPADQSPLEGEAHKPLRQFQAGNTGQPGPAPRLPADAAAPLADIDVVSLAMRQFYQSPANAGG